MWSLWEHFAFDDLAIWLIALILCTIVVEAVTEIISSSALFAPLHTYLGKKAIPEDPKDCCWYWTFLHKLFTCGYCCSVWVSLAAALLMPGSWFGIWPWDNLIIKVFLLHRISNLYHSAFELFRRGRVVTYDIKLDLKIAESKEQNNDSNR